MNESLRPKQLHNAIVSYFSGVSSNAKDPLVRDIINDHALSGNYDKAHYLTRIHQILNPESPYGKFNKFPVKLFAEYDQNKQNKEKGMVKSAKNMIHPSTRSIGLSLKALRHIAAENWNKLDDVSIQKISDAVAEHGFSSKNQRPLDSSDIVQYARQIVQKYPSSQERELRRSYDLLMFGLYKGMYGTDRDPEKQRKQDMDTDFFRVPKTYRGVHPDHKRIVAYFNHFSRPLSEDARMTIMHDANIGEYGSAQRKLARRNDGLPAGLDGLKFGDHQIEMVKQMSEEGIF